MKSIIYLCLLFIVNRKGSAASYDDFRPTPIPLDDWNNDRSGEKAGTLQEVIATNAPPTVAAIPAHYWEDALRHSVYLTLVRDKIDQLIAKGSVISPDSKPNPTVSKEVDDHNLWEKIKTAPFDRLNPEEPSNLGDFTILAKGRLLETSKGYRFIEDDKSKEKCSNNTCMEDVKAFWSVKRVRQRDAETVPGKYHYELTFSVTSQTQKKHRRPYDNPVRTFTVRETNPYEQLNTPTEQVRVPINARPQRAIWVHKNIHPAPTYHSRKTFQGSSLDRLFFSFFGDDDPTPEPPRHKPVYQPHTNQQQLKLGYVSQPDYQNKKISYRYKPQPNSPKYPVQRPGLVPAAPIVPPPLANTNQHYNEFETKHNPPVDYKYLPTNIIKTTRPGVIPTPPLPFPYPNATMEVNKYNSNETTTREPEIITYKVFTKPKPQPTKVSYFEHVRPPIFNAPPGVFVTMDKKPFKPMPPLKFTHLVKPNKNKPIDFRPSPQVLDAQFSDPEPLSDSFRPISMNFADTNTTEPSALPATFKTKLKSKPLKKHENIKSQRTTTNAPEIITAHNSVSMEQMTLDSMHWASNILGAFSKTTPALTYNAESYTLEPTTTIATPEETTSISTTTEEERREEPTTTTTTTPKPKKRTRPPPKYNKPEKIKKHKRITTTTTTTTTTSTTTVKPKHHSKRPLPDLTPQASSAATGNQNLESQNETTTIPTNIKETTTTTSTTPRPTTTRTTTTPTTTTTFATTTQQKNKNRFRQSTLMLKGTSVKHDKWSTPNTTILDKSKTVIPLSNKSQGRRKASNFQGYVSSTVKTIDESRHKEDHSDVSQTYFNEVSSTRVSLQTQKISDKQNEQTNVESPINNVDESQFSDLQEQEGSIDDQELKDQNEYIFSVTTEPTKVDSEGNEPEVNIATETSLITSPHSASKNKTKCKKKKQPTDGPTTLSNDLENEVLPSTTETAVSDIFDEIFGFTAENNQTTDEVKEGSENHEQFSNLEDDIEKFLDSLTSNNTKNNTNDHDTNYDDENDEDGDDSNDYANFSNEEESRTSRHADINYDYRERPYSLLELMAME